MSGRKTEKNDVLMYVTKYGLENESSAKIVYTVDMISFHNGRSASLGNPSLTLARKFDAVQRNTVISRSMIPSVRRASPFKVLLPKYTVGVGFGPSVSEVEGAPSTAEESCRAGMESSLAIIGDAGAA